MVFSGIVEEIGTVESIHSSVDTLLWNGERGNGWVLRIAARTVLEGATLGCSIAVNGTCLTVTEFSSSEFVVGLAPETIRRTNLGALVRGSEVNLERSLPVNGRNSGHLVQGHVDEAGTIVATWREGDSLWVRIRVSAGLLAQIVPKGYVAVDGTSLTVCEVNSTEGWFTLMLISYTQRHVTLARKAVGDAVNIEADAMGKYAQRAVEGVHAALQALEARLTAGMDGLAARLGAMEERLGKLEGPSAATGGAASR